MKPAMGTHGRIRRTRESIGRPLFSLCLALLILLLWEPVWARKAFISDSFVVSLHEAPGAAGAVRGQLNSGQRLEVLEERGEWSRVRVLEGKDAGLEGWILKQNLSREPPWEKRFSVLKEENIELKTKLNRMESDLNNLSMEKLDLEKKLDQLRNRLALLRKEYSELKGGTESYQQLRSRLERLQDILAAGRRGLKELRAENTGLKEREWVKWLLTGGLILLCGLWLGLIMGRQHRRRRPGVYY